MSKIEELAEREAEKICAEASLRVYDVEYKKEGADWCLRIFIDSLGDAGVTLDDCEKVSRALSERLDALDPIEQAYELEVSSPGIERLLKRSWHFEKAIGKQIEAKLFSPIDGKKVIKGTLVASDDNTVTIEEAGKSIVIEKEKASQIKTVFNF